jgi:hypothetical protein
MGGADLCTIMQKSFNFGTVNLRFNVLNTENMANHLPSILALQKVSGVEEVTSYATNITS